MNIVFIPARGGSKSIPLKNIKSFCGKPLVFWVANAALQAVKVDKIVIATDSAEIKDTVNALNFEKLEVYDRNPINAQDTSSTESVMLEYIGAAKIDPESTMILLQATSPFLKATDIDEGLDQLAASEKDSLLSCANIKRFFWQKDGNPMNYDFNHRPRRQDFDGALIENGAMYINKVKNIVANENRLNGSIDIYEMPEYTMTEIDEPDDWVYAEYLMKKYLLKKEKKEIQLFLSDVDGVLTDAGMYYTEEGDELKKFNTRDGKGFELLRNANIKTGIITSENTKIVERRAQKLKIDYLYQGKEHGGKLAAALVICKELNIDLSEVAYIGDDVNCYELLTHVGYAACPGDAVDQIQSIPNILRLNSKGGEGAVREFVNILLS
ncbi:MAG: acylneuraminate cytidylyltransferase [Flavobacteriaceae bacterium]|nr:acylneuraminate cytidylyltransferase [Flavobacteriaceae bacterium]